MTKCIDMPAVVSDAKTKLVEPAVAPLLEVRDLKVYFPFQAGEFAATESGDLCGRWMA